MMNNYIYYMCLNGGVLLLILMIVLIGVAFLTLLERKILGYVHMRKGPNKVGIVGIFQPFSDAIKLFSKEFFFIYKSNYFMFYFSSMLMFFFMIISWYLMGIFTNIYFLNYSLIFIIIILSLMSYMMMLMGWSSNSLYSLIGSIRVIAQVVSYEISLIFIILMLMLLSESYSFLDFLNWQIFGWYMFMFFPLLIVMFISVLAELNRTPMDFIEGESELVSGFNIEYFSGSFALIFMSEYGMLLFFSYLILMMFTSLILSNFLYIYIFMNLFVICILFLRGLLPRMRYDELMYLCWKLLLPFILNYLIYIFGLKFMLMMLL